MPALLTLTLILALATALHPEGASASAPPRFPQAGTLSWASVAVRRAPDRRAPVIRVLHQFRPDFRPQVVFALERRRGADGGWWYRLEVPMRPNGTTGWIRAAAAEVKPVHVTVVVHRSARRLEILRDGRRLYGTAAAVGMPGAETPLGSFYVTARFWPTDSFYGPFALETSAYSRLSDWPGGGVVGIHGTSLPQLLGQAVSHGCVRVSNAAALVLERLVSVGSAIRVVR